MIEGRTRIEPLRFGRFLRLVTILMVAVISSGCQTASYYTQAIQGQLQILSHRQRIHALLADPQTPIPLKEKFQLILKLREFAQQQLALPVDGHYLRYVDLHRPYVVWNVHAAPEFSLRPKTWWYPVVGRLDYRGYFADAGARQYGRTLAKNGFDVYIEGVEAYSTLGWFRDPVLNTFAHHQEAELAETIFHELAHQRLFVAGDTDFNEAFATAAAEEGVRRWLRAADHTVASQEYLVGLKRNEQFVRLVANTRRQLEALYGDGKSGKRNPFGAHHNPEGSGAGKRQRKEAILAKLRDEYQGLKSEWEGYSGYDNWFARSLNNAQLNTIATYYDLVPAFRHRLEANGGDLEKFYREVRGLARFAKPERHRRLNRGHEP